MDKKKLAKAKTFFFLNTIILWTISSFYFLFFFLYVLFFLSCRCLLWNRTPAPTSILHFQFSHNPPIIFPTFPGKLIHVSLVKSLLKLDTFEGIYIWPSTQMVTVKTNNPYYHHTSWYLFPSLFFLSLSLVFRSFLSVYIFYIFTIIASISSITKM